MRHDPGPRHGQSTPRPVTFTLIRSVICLSASIERRGTVRPERGSDCGATAER